MPGLNEIYHDTKIRLIRRQKNLKKARTAIVIAALAYVYYCHMSGCHLKRILSEDDEIESRAVRFAFCADILNDKVSRSSLQQPVKPMILRT